MKASWPWDMGHSNGVYWKLTLWGELLINPLMGVVDRKKQLKDFKSSCYNLQLLRGSTLKKLHNESRTFLGR